MIKWLKDQIEAFEWLKSWFKKKSTKNILIILGILLTALLWWDTHRYSKILKSVDKIYLEVLSNMQELNSIISTEKDLAQINHSKYKFLLNAYDNDFTTNKQHLDQQLNNFYTNLQKIEVFKKSDEFGVIVNQGKYIKDKFNYYFGCKDYFDYIEDWKKRPRVVSGQTVVLRFYPKNYLRYKFR